MGFISQLLEKPWQVNGIVPAGHPASSGLLISNPKLGLRFFFVVVSILFMLLTIAYAERIVSEEWRPSPQPALLWTSTAMLFLASIGLQWAQYNVKYHRTGAVKLGLIMGGVFAFAFLGAQLFAWRQLSSIAVLNLSNPAIAFFYLITTLHALHLFGGLVAWGVLTVRVWRGYAIESVGNGIELCTAYWHFLLIIWVILFGLLFSGNDNLAALLAICGLR